MRRVTLSLVLAVAFNNFGFAQVSNGSQQRPVLLNETTDWLKKMLVAKARYVNPYPDGSTVENIVDSVNFEGCDFSYRDTIRSSEPDPIIQALEFTFCVPLAELDPARGKVESDEGRAKLILFTLGDKPTIKGTIGAKSSTGASAYQSRVVITFESLAIANLVAPAFKQAIQLCQKQRERF